MPRLRRPFLPLLALALGTPLAAQEPPVVDPGGVATIVVRLDDSPGDTVRYVVRPAEGVRPLSSTEGTAVADRDGRVHLPFTFGIPSGAGSGVLPVGRLLILGRDGATEERELAVRIAATREAGLWISVDRATTSPGEMLEFGYRLHNRGNAADTFRIGVATPGSWSGRVHPERVILVPGDTAMGVVQLTPPHDAPRGRQQLVKVTLDGTGLRRTASATVTVVTEESWLGDLAQIPGYVFLGASSSDPGLPGVGIRAAGDIAGGTRVSVALRHSEAGPAPTAFRAPLSGPQARLTIEATDWGVRAGEIFVPGNVFTGPTQAGRGIDVSAARGTLSGRVRIAAPGSFGSLREEGHLLETAAAVERPYGRIGLQLSSVERRSSFLEDYGLVGGGVTYSLHHGAHGVTAEAGLLRVSTDSVSRTGFAGHADYRHSWEGGTLSARLRMTPGTTARTASQGREAFLSGTVDIRPGVAATGWGFVSSAPRITDDPYSVSQGAAAGLRLQLPRDATAQLLGQLRRSERVGGAAPSVLRRSILTSLDMPLGPVRLESSADLGAVTSQETRPYRNLRAGVRWSRQRQWGWLGISHYDSGLGYQLTALDLAGALEIRAAELQAGVNIDLGSPRPGEALSLWSVVSYPVAAAYEVSAGIDYRGRSLEPWGLSLGVRRRIALPLPIRRSPVLHGVVYEDLDGDRVRDPDEPVLPDVEVWMGALRATTDEDGRFRFHDDGRGALRLSPAALPLGLVVPADIVLPSSGSVDIPVIRTAAIELLIFLDRDLDGVHDDAESFARGAVVSVTDADGRARDATTDARGRVRLGNLPPGTYTIRVYPQPNVALEPPFEITIVLGPGAEVARTLAVPLRRREIRMPDGTRMDPSGPPLVP